MRRIRQSNGGLIVLNSQTVSILGQMSATLITTPEDSVYQRASRLAAVRNAVSEVFGGGGVEITDPTDLKEVVRSVRRAIADVSGSYGTIIGGLAVQELGYLRWTEDVDVVVDAEHFSEILENLRNSGFVLKADFTLQKRDSGAQLDLLKEGATLKDSQLPLPHPSELGPNRGFATLAGLTRLKLDTDRMKDMSDIVELFKQSKARLDDIPNIRKTIPAPLLAKFDQLAAQARKEAGA